MARNVVEAPFGTVEVEEGVDLDEVARAVADHMRDPVQEMLTLLVERDRETRQALQEVQKQLVDVIQAGNVSLNALKEALNIVKQGQVAIVEELQKPVVPKYNSQGKLIAAQRI